jgi:SAM-dependent methyltransferase
VNATASIQARDCPRCPLCQRDGHWLYRDLADRLCGAPGLWNIRQCTDAGCGLLWLDPMPLDEELPRLYENYHTHDTVAAPERTLYHLLLRLTPIHRQRQRLDAFYLDDLPPGRLLEVGCGSGQRLARLQQLGWQVQGQEIDPRINATPGIPIHIGPLDTAPFVPQSFDAVALNHVIEHVPNPVAFLATCQRFLRPGGRLVAITPNANGDGHRAFGPDWRGLEPPRHLHIFNPRNLRTVAERAGLRDIAIETTGARSVGVALAGYKRFRKLRAVLFQLRARAEVCVLKATP